MASMTGCGQGGKSIDLSKIDFAENADKYLNGLNYSSKEVQKGHYQVMYNGDNVSLELKDNGEKVIFQLTLMPTENFVNNTLVVISKKAFRDKIIIGFHNPDKDPILSKYLDYEK